MSKTIRLAIDGNEANIENRVGSNVYAFQILAALYAQASSQKLQCTIFLADVVVSDMPPQSSYWKYKVIGPRKFWTQWALPRFLFTHKNEFDVFYTPGHYAPRFCPIPSVVSVMDTAYLVFPQQFKRKDYLQLKYWTKYSVKNAQKIIAISEFTKSEIHKFYKKNADDILVATPAASKKLSLPSTKKQEEILLKLRVNKPYFLFVGTIQPRKNITTLLDAFDKFIEAQRATSTNSKNDTEYQLVIAGKIGWLSEPILEKAKNSLNSSKIIFTDYVSNLEKAVLYANSKATVLPGLYEGFGIPPLEALLYRSIPIVSNTSSLPEVVGSAGLLINPNSITEIADALQKVAHLSQKERSTYITGSQSQLKKFSWIQSASIVISAIKEIVKIKL
ncbi:MAG: glycosyltransferase family 1 protein [Microgenomates group bacterium]